ncbi:MAG TPA: hypothetical protein VFI31_09560 [Pirellulales bacterium]|nr:hypothetical protein [Pirellulales bacterium]
MKLLLFKPQLRYAICAMAMTLSCIGTALAQVESIEPNPTQPFDIDTDFGYGPTGRGARFGRGPARPGQPREENPAETMLRDIEGTNYGHYSGRAIAGYRGATAPRGGRPENRWRYRFHRGRWWYWTPGGRWSYFNGRRWIPYSSR